MDVARFSLSALALALLAGCDARAGWMEAKELPVSLQDGLEIARNDRARRTASLNLVCDSDGHLRLMLHTRLPIPDDLRNEARISGMASVLRDEQVSVFVQREQQGIAVSYVIADRLDEIISDPLSDLKFANLVASYGRQAPDYVSVAGIQETGISLRGRATGAELQEFGLGCRSGLPTGR